MKLVIIGGGFAGLRLANKLNNNAGFDITLIDKFNHHQFQPLFYQVATGALDASNISFPLRKAFHTSTNVKVRLATVEKIVTEEKKVITNVGEYAYDALVIATGADTNFFGNAAMQANALSMKSTVEALQIKYHLIQNFESALVEKDPEKLQRLLNVVVVGGGATGVEVSGAIAEMKGYVLPKDYPELDLTKMNIYLVEGSEKTLEVMSEKSSADSARYLKKLGVAILNNTKVKAYDGNIVEINPGNAIPSATVIWAAGIKGNVPDGIDADVIVRGNRIKVDRHSKVEGFANVYAIGDIAAMATPKWANGHPQLASVAIQQATLLANNLKKIERKAPNTVEEFEYSNQGSMATIGRNLAVVDLPKPKLHFNGLFAWLIWMGLHLMLILGVKNRLFIFINWVYNYVTYDQSLWLVFKNDKKKG